MSELDPITILVLGPMQPRTSTVAEAAPRALALAADDEGAAERAPRTVELTALIDSIINEIKQTPGAVETNLRCEGPDDNPVATIIPGILRKLERADLVVCDVSAGSQNVMYELGLVHALGSPYIILTESDRRPFYLANVFCITRFEPKSQYDPNLTSHKQLIDRVRAFLGTLRPLAAASPEDFAANPVSEYFDRLPLVDISAPAGLAAGYWSNFVRRFVRQGGYFDPLPRQISLPGGVERTLQIQYLIAVAPLDGLNKPLADDEAALASTLQRLGYATTQGAINAVDRHDMRTAGVRFLTRLLPDGTAAAIEDPAIVIDIPTTLYALQYSARIDSINAQERHSSDRFAAQRLLARRYKDMIRRFGHVLAHLQRKADYKGHLDRFHYVEMRELPDLLNRLVRSP